MAQTCASDPAVAGTPSAAPSAWTVSGILESTGTGINCHTLTNGLDLTLGPDLAMGTEGTPLTERGIEADGDGNNDIAVKGSAVIHATGSGIYMTRDGTGLLGLELTDGRIVVTGADEGDGIDLLHTGEASADSKGIRIVSGADIDLSGNTTADKTGIYAHTDGAPETGGRATATVPITVRVTGGTIDVGTSAGGSEEGTAVWVNQHAKGDTAITVEPGAALGREGSVAGGKGIYVLHESVSEGDITITHRGRIYGGDGIYVNNDSTSERKGNIAITTDPGSTTVAQGDRADGIVTWISRATGTGDIAITHNGEITAGLRGIYTYNDGKGHVTVTTGKGSGIVSRGVSDDDENEFYGGISAGLWGASSDADAAVTHGGGIMSRGEGVYAFNRVSSAGGTGAVRVTTVEGSRVAAEGRGILVWHRGTGRSHVTVRGTVTGDSAHTDGGGTGYAGVRILVTEDDTRAGGGGELVIGPRAHVSSGSGTAVRIDARAGDWTVVLERDGYGLAGHLEGRILNADSAATAFRARAGETGAATALSVGDRVDMRGRTNGVYDRVHRTRLATVTGGHEFKKVSETRCLP